MSIEQAEQILIDAEQASLRNLDTAVPPVGGKAMTHVPLSRAVLYAMTLTKLPTRHRTYIVSAQWRWTGERFELIDRIVAVKQRKHWIPIAALARSDNDPWTLTSISGTR